MSDEAFPGAGELIPEEKREERNFRTMRWYRPPGTQLDADAFQPLFEKIMGGRSMNEFARDTGINVSSVSRLSNGTAKEPTLQILLQILDNASPNSGVSGEEFLIAAGFRALESVSDIQARRIAHEKRVKMIIVAWLMEQGHTVRELFIERMVGRPMYYKADITLETSALPGYWEIVVQAPLREPADDDMRVISYAHNARRTFLQALGARYLEKDPQVPVKYTVAFSDKRVYMKMLQYFSEAAVRDETSFILVDLESESVADEYIFPRKGERR